MGVNARRQDLLDFNRDGKLQYLHLTVKDFLSTKDMRGLLDMEAVLCILSPHEFHTFPIKTYRPRSETSPG